MVTVCLNNGNLLKLYQKRMTIEHELCLEVEEDVHDYGLKNLDKE